MSEGDPEAEGELTLLRESPPSQLASSEWPRPFMAPSTACATARAKERLGGKLRAMWLQRRCSAVSRVGRDSLRAFTTDFLFGTAY